MFLKLVLNFYFVFIGIRLQEDIILAFNDIKYLIL